MSTPQQITLRMLRECQSRSAREQQILSGRDWLFVTALVQFLTALYPIYRWVTDVFVFGHADAVYGHDMKLAAGMVGVCAISMALWGWAKHAPFRAAIVALGFFVALQVYGMSVFPAHALDNFASKVLVLLGLIMAVRAGYRRRHSG